MATTTVCAFCRGDRTKLHTEDCPRRPSKFEIGDLVEWVIDSPIHHHMRGEIVEVVAAGVLPTSTVRQRGDARNHESYVVKSFATGRARYWPALAALRLAPDAAAPRAIEPEIAERTIGGDWRPVTGPTDPGPTDTADRGRLTAMARDLWLTIDTADKDKGLVALAVAVEAECGRAGLAASASDITLAVLDVVVPPPPASGAAAFLSEARMRMRSALRSALQRPMADVVTGNGKGDLLAKLLVDMPRVAGWPSPPKPIAADYMLSYAAAVIAAMVTEWHADVDLVIEEELAEADMLVTVAAAYGLDDEDTASLFRFTAGGICATLRRRSIKLPHEWVSERANRRLATLARDRATAMVGDGKQIETIVHDYLSSRARPGLNIGSEQWLPSVAPADEDGIAELGRAILRLAGAPDYPTTPASLIAGRVVCGFIAPAEAKEP